eukprot:TRINITY_DN18625_c0_g1_i4.p2 TRINITY_DN18625_c0_g1~~TRINITY_DN18625_c0_g1_i4.p2  ORF type:complete len:122 (-),score=20.75 TRINITY_DN18625_c0_g1_i4:111-440(-)
MDAAARMNSGARVVASANGTATLAREGSSCGSGAVVGVATPGREATLAVSRQTGVGRFRIEGFSLLRRKKGDAVTSGPVIDVGDAQWEILVYPRGNDRCKDGWMRVSVR